MLQEFGTEPRAGPVATAQHAFGATCMLGATGWSLLACREHKAPYWGHWNGGRSGQMGSDHIWDGSEEQTTVCCLDKWVCCSLTSGWISATSYSILCHTWTRFILSWFGIVVNVCPHGDYFFLREGSRVQLWPSWLLPERRLQGWRLSKCHAAAPARQPGNEATPACGHTGTLRFPLRALHWLWPAVRCKPLLSLFGWLVSPRLSWLPGSAGFPVGPSCVGGSHLCCVHDSNPVSVTLGPCFQLSSCHLAWRVWK